MESPTEQAVAHVAVWAECYVRAIDSGEGGEQSLELLRLALEKWKEVRNADAS